MRRRQIARGVVYKEGEEFKTGGSDQQVVEWSHQQDPNSWDTPEVLEKKTDVFPCPHCGREYKFKMHLVRHEKKCKQKE